MRSRASARLLAMHLSPGFSVLVAVDDAPYETVATLLESLRQNRIHDVFIMPPFQGTNPSKSVKRWIKFAVDGEIELSVSDCDDFRGKIQDVAREIHFAATLGFCNCG